MKKESTFYVPDSTPRIPDTAFRSSRLWSLFLVLVFLVMAITSTYALIVDWDGKRTLGGILILSGKIIYVEQGSEAEKAGIKEGDELVSIDDFYFITPEGQIKETLSSDEMERFSELLEAGTTRTVVVRRFNPPDSTPHYITTQLSVTVSLSQHIKDLFLWFGSLLAALVSLRYGTRESATLHLRLVSLFFSLGHASLVLDNIYSMPTGVEVVGLLSVVGLFSEMWLPVWIHINLIWPIVHPLKKKFPSLIYLIYGFYGVIFTITYSWWFLIEFHAINDQELTVFGILITITYGMVIAFFVFLIILFIQQHRMSNYWQRQQNRWLHMNLIPAFFFLFIVILFTILSDISLYVLEEPLLGLFFASWSIDVMIIWGGFGMPLLAITMIMASLKYRLDWVETLFNKSLIYSIISAVIIVITLFFAGILVLLTQRWATITEPWAVVCLTILAVMVMMPVKKSTSKKLDRRLRGQVVDLYKLKDHFDEFIIQEIEANKLIHHLVETLQCTFSSASAFVYLKSTDKEIWRLASFVKLSAREIEYLSEGPPVPLTQFLYEKPEPTSRLKLLSRTSIQIKEDVHIYLVKILESLQADAVVPIITHRDINGILCLGPKPRKGIYSSEELSLLRAIAAKVGMGMTNALAYEMVKEEVAKRTREVVEAKEQLERLTTRMKHFLSPQLIETLSRAEEDKVLFMSKRIKLTIFFSDIRGFTEITDQMEPEELAELLNHYLSEMSSIALRHGGTIDKYVGDAIMIFFGAPEVTTDHALRCVRMAWQMQERMKELSHLWRQRGIQNPLSIRIGINTGYATVGSFGSPQRLDYTAIGGQVNLASRLESLCEPGKILISFSTNALVAEEFETVSKGEITVKGIHYPVETFQILRKKQ